MLPDNNFFQKFILNLAFFEKNWCELILLPKFMAHYLKAARMSWGAYLAWKKQLRVKFILKAAQNLYFLFQLPWLSRAKMRAQNLPFCVVTRGWFNYQSLSLSALSTFVFLP